MSASVNACKMILKLMLGDRADRWLVCSYRERFTDLWDMIRSGFSQGEWVCIIYDGVPAATASDDSPPAVHRYITAYDWLVAAAFASREVPGRRFILVDIIGGARVSRGLIASFLNNPDAIHLANPEGIIRLFAEIDTESSLPVSSSGPPAGIRVLRDLWSIRLTRPGGLHEISNWLAPYLMSYALKAKGCPGATELVEQLEADRLRRALLIQVEALGLLPSSSSPCLPYRPDEKIREPTRDDPFGRFAGQTRVLLVDDQFDQGYRDIISCLLFGDAGRQEDATFRLDCSASPDELARWLEQSISQPSPRLVGSNCILLLDLRLFTRRLDGNQEETLFLRRLLDLYKSSGWSSPSLDDAAESARTRVSNPDTEGFGHLAFLPLLLSQADPSLPIVLFSSSQQRSVWRALDGRPNIITSFAKPVVSGYRNEVSGTDAIEDLVEAIAKALQLHKTRIVWEALVSFSNRVPISVNEQRLLTQGGNKLQYTLDRCVVEILEAEFERLLVRGRFADALVVPDNILERTDAKVAPPGVLTDIDLLFLSDARATEGCDWCAFVDKSLCNQGLSWAILATTPLALATLKQKTTPSVNGALNKLSHYFAQKGHARSGWLGEFEKRDRGAAATLISAFGSLEKLLNLAFSNHHAGILSRSRDIAEVLGSYCFYFVLATMRHLRAHFRIGPGDDERVENCTVWVWLCFLYGSAAGASFIAGDAVTANSLLSARQEKCLPRRSVLDPHAPGPEAAKQILATIGHLIRLGVLKPAIGMEVPATLAVTVARSIVP